jgi:hypothetical protein
VSGLIRRHRVSIGSCWRKLNPGQQPFSCWPTCWPRPNRRGEGPASHLASASRQFLAAAACHGGSGLLSISFCLPGLAARPQQLDFAHGLVRFVSTGAIQPCTQDRAAQPRPLRKSLIASARPGDRTGQIGISGSVVVEPSPNPDLYQREGIIINEIAIMKAAII